ncbi:MAG: phosphoglycerate kinase [Candidatus Pacebacteria bacterium]|nr:phosphoglycerate kinase [Candidatus Paceibacterota bacterium]MDR3583555.1 phosphoglycerate kinase [Candidatus Paceibacterota bacterium]
MDIKKIQDAEMENKKILLRVDFNVAVENGRVKEKFKIEAAKETVNYLLSKNCKIALLSHFGRPEGKVDPDFSLEQLVPDVAESLGVKINFISDCLGEKVADGLEKASDKEVLLLENVRFYSGDESNNEEFAEKLAAGFDVFINDAFSVCHRDQASVTGITKFLPSFAGFQLQKEIEEMEKLMRDYARPAVAIIGGAKIETKLSVIKFFDEKYDHVLVGGKIANEALEKNMTFSEKVILPTDFAEDHFDVGPETINKFSDIIKSAKTIVWNGPTGKFEEEKFAVSTNAVLEAVIQSGAYTVVGGGETLEVLEKNDAMDKISFVSTGGGAMLSYLGGEKMPGIEALRSS